MYAWMDFETWLNDPSWTSTAGNALGIARHEFSDVEPQATLGTMDFVQHADPACPELPPDELLGSFIPGIWTLIVFNCDALSRV